MNYEVLSTHQIVKRCVEHEWSVPELQREFCWRPAAVREWATSLNRGFPGGSLLLWDCPDIEIDTEPRFVRDAVRPLRWIIDGHQRCTALCIMFGRKPYWWPSRPSWDEIMARCDIRLDVHGDTLWEFRLADATVRREKTHRFVSLATLLTLDPESDQDQQILKNLSRAIERERLCPNLDSVEIYSRLNRVRQVRDYEIVCQSIDHDLDDVHEIFRRLDTFGSKVRAGDVYLGLIAVHCPGWVRDTFTPFLHTLADSGFDIEPDLLLRSVTGLALNKTRFAEIDKGFWSSQDLQRAWQRTRVGWQQLLANFRQFGILASAPLPSQAALVAMVALSDRFATERWEPALYWLLQAARYGRYNSAGTSAQEEDLRDIAESYSLSSAVERLCRRFPDEPLKAADFLRDYSDSRFGRFLLYLLAYERSAQDWCGAGHRLGFDLDGVLAPFRLDWHHIWPRQYLSSHQVYDDLIDALANIAVISSATNIRISTQAPLDYLQRYGIGADRLAQQLIGADLAELTVEQYPEWLNRRAEALASAGNKLLTRLRGTAG